MLNGHPVCRFEPSTVGRVLRSRKFSSNSALLLLEESHRLVGDDQVTERVESQQLWRVGSGPRTQSATVAAFGAQSEPLFSSDEQWVAVMQESTVVEELHWSLRSANTWQEISVIPANTGASRQFSPDSKTIAGLTTKTPSWFERFGIVRSSSDGKALGIWEIPTGRPNMMIPDVDVFSYFPDGERIVTGRLDGTIQIWEIPPRRPDWVEYGLPILFMLLLVVELRLFYLRFAMPAAGLPASSTAPRPAS